ncbi:lysis system i-spanin subunit Rz [Pseudomonas sp. GG8]
MSLTDWIPAQYRVLTAGLLLTVLASASAAAAWQVQNWRYGQQLEHQARLHSATLNEITLASAALQRKEQDKRLQVEQQLQQQDKTHHQELTDAKKRQGLLRERLATADLRLSVLVSATDTTSLCGVPATTGAGSVVHGATRAHLDPAHAQRIIGITDDGDQGLIALAACQAYAKTVSPPK